jgi:cytochrome c553
MPEIVAHGKRPEIRACGLCHYPNGKGRQENAASPAAGVVLHPDDERFPNAAAEKRGAAEDEHESDDCVRQGHDSEEIKETAEYFGAMTWTPWIRVVETNTVPKMISRGGIWCRSKAATRTDRRSHRRNARVSRADRNPARSARRIHRLRSGRERQERRDACENRRRRRTEVRRLPRRRPARARPVPGIAGRSPSYLTRQMYDMQAGARRANGPS